MEKSTGHTFTVHNWWSQAKAALMHLAFPHVCAGCGTDTIDHQHFLCLQCLEALPQTHFEQHTDNPVEKLFTGRLPLTHATAQYYFTKSSLIQQLSFAFKYRGHRDLGFYLGQLMGLQLALSTRLTGIDALVPLPLFASKEHKRGYNQAMVLCEGMATVFDKPILKEAVIRTASTESQTKKSRVARWQNMEDRFELANPDAINGKHLLLVDDVVTTGATLEACGRALRKAEGVQLSIATLCFSAS